MATQEVNKSDVKSFVYKKIRTNLLEVPNEFKNESDSISATKVRCLAQKLLENYNDLQRFASLIEFLEGD